MDKGERVLCAQFPAAIDHFLAATLHLWIRPLHRGEIQVFIAFGAIDRRRGATTQANLHGRPAQDDQLGADRNGIPSLVDMFFFDVAIAAGDHNRLMVAAYLGAIGAGHRLLKGSEIAGQVGPAKFVIKGGATERTIEHDIQGADDATGFAIAAFPWLFEARNTQIGHAETGQSGLRLTARPGGALIANLTTGTGCRAGKGCDRRGMVMGFNLKQNMDVLFMIAIVLILIWIISAGLKTLYN